MNDSQLNVIVTGAMGRMGQMILNACTKDSGIRVTGAVEAPGSDYIGKSTGVKGADLVVSGNLADCLTPGSVLIDFTVPRATIGALQAVRKAGAKVVIGTTGLTEADKAVIAETAEFVPIVFSPNMSIGVNLLFKLTEMVSKCLDESYDAEIIEAHHRHKKDAPSGTAIGLAEALARGRGVALEEKGVYGRQGLTGERPRGEFGIHAVRGGDIVGDHTVLFAGDGERIELRHMAHSRATFAGGAVKAAHFLRSKDKGLFTMADVLGLR